MPEALKYLTDAVVGFALFMALVVVYIVDLWISGTSANTLPGVIAKEEKPLDLKRLKLAVTPTGQFKDGLTKKVEKWDDMGKLLDELGDGYRYENITMQDAIDLKKLSQYDVVFLTCAGGAEDQLKDVLPAYVTQGGILYASDWRFDAVAKAFPDMVVPALKAEGARQDFEADIVDPGLRDHLKVDKIHLRFDLDQWKVAAFGGPRVKTLIKGSFRKYKSTEATAPLMVKFSVGKGTVVFTSFHNEKQNSDLEKQLLQYLVFSLVTAGIDADVNSQMDKGGFTPQPSNLLSTGSKQTTPPKTYRNATVSTLRFVLGFRNEGAKMRFNIRSPDGKQFTQDCQATLTLEVPNAAAGDWTYTVTALDLPYPNFPFTVTVGEKK